jgi:hypothetical protein
MWVTEIYYDIYLTKSVSLTLIKVITAAHVSIIQCPKIARQDIATMKQNEEREKGGTRLESNKIPRATLFFKIIISGYCTLCIPRLGSES